MMQWAVESKVYDNGKVVLTAPYSVSDLAMSSLHELKKCDLYIDVYPTKEEADAAYQEMSKEA